MARKPPTPDHSSDDSVAEDAAGTSADSTAQAAMPSSTTDDATEAAATPDGEPQATPDTSGTDPAPDDAHPGLPHDDGTGNGVPPGTPWPTEYPAGDTGNRFFSWMRSLDIPRQPGWIGGVCSGIAARLGIDPLIVRGIFVVIAIFGGPALLLYAAGWLLLPDTRNKIHLEEVFRGNLEAPIAGIGAMVLLALLPITQGFWFSQSFFWDGPELGAALGRTIWTVILIGLAVAFVIWIAQRSRNGATARTNAPTAPAYRATAPDATGTTAPSTDNIPTAAFAAGAEAGPGSESASTAFAAAPSTAQGVPTAPLAPGPNAPHEEVAAWRAQQAQWKLEREAYRRQQSLAAQQVQQEALLERERIRQQERERSALSRSNPLYTFVVIGLSLIAGALTTMAFDGHVLVGLTVTLAVLAAGIIINGIRGKRGGGATGLAWIVIVALLFGTTVTRVPVFFGNNSSGSNTIVAANDSEFAPRFDAGQSVQTFMVGAGDVEMDLSDFFVDTAPGDSPTQRVPQVTLLVGAGDIDLQLPRDIPVLITVELGNGTISAADKTIAEAKGWRGSAYTFTAPGKNATERPQLHLRIGLGSGDVNINRTLEIGDNR